MSPAGPLIGPADEVYLSFKETPHDVLPPGYEDGDNSQVSIRHMQALKDALALPPAAAHDEPVGVSFTAALPRRVIVPHPRDLKKGCVGSDVLALQRALASAKERKWGNFTRAFGAGVLAETKKFQASRDIRATGVYGEETHRALSPYYDAYGIELLTEYAAKSALQKAQNAVLAAAMVSYNFRNTIHYTEGSLRWMMVANRILEQSIPAQGSLWADCSAWFTWVYWAIGAPDPNNLDWAGGFTGTLGVNGTVVGDPSKAPIGAGFLYGPGDHSHIALSVGGENTIGNGSEAGPLYLPADYRDDLNVVRKYALN